LIFDINGAFSLIHSGYSEIPILDDLLLSVILVFENKADNLDFPILVVDHIPMHNVSQVAEIAHTHIAGFGRMPRRPLAMANKSKPNRKTR